MKDQVLLRRLLPNVVAHYPRQCSAYYRLFFQEISVLGKHHLHKLHKPLNNSYKTINGRNGYNVMCNKWCNIVSGSFTYLNSRHILAQNI